MFRKDLLQKTYDFSLLKVTDANPFFDTLNHLVTKDKDVIMRYLTGLAKTLSPNFPFTNDLESDAHMAINFLNWACDDNLFNCSESGKWFILKDKDGWWWLFYVEKNDFDEDLSELENIKANDLIGRIDHFTIVPTYEPTLDDAVGWDDAVHPVSFTNGSDDDLILTAMAAWEAVTLNVNAVMSKIGAVASRQKFVGIARTIEEAYRSRLTENADYLSHLSWDWDVVAVIVDRLIGDADGDLSKVSLDITTALGWLDELEIVDPGSDKGLYRQVKDFLDESDAPSYIYEALDKLSGRGE